MGVDAWLDVKTPANEGLYRLRLGLLGMLTKTFGFRVQRMLSIDAA